MSHIAYVNGSYVAHANAAVHVEDRGYQFADGAYEYIAFYNKHIMDESEHVERLARSLKELDIDAGHSCTLLPIIMRELIARNHRSDGALYVQITRGTAKRDHVFPAYPKANIVATVWGSKMPSQQQALAGVSAVTYPDQRWGRCDIKSVSLLANVLAKQYAVEQGAKESWLINHEGHITEGAVSNAFIVREGVIHTHPSNQAILGGITRKHVLHFAAALGIAVKEEPFTQAEAETACEAFLTSTSANVQPVIKLNNLVIGNGKAGPVTRQLMEAFADKIKNNTGKIW